MDCVGYSPISLPNVDAKFLTPTLAHRLQTALLTIVYFVQLGFMKNNQIPNNIRLLILYEHYMLIKTKQLFELH